ncbi:MAG: oligopeptide/dipeptide ABC transporter ATP-binding protein [Candidatus Nanopelagicales bacterium]
MYLGSIVETGPTDNVLSAPRHHYTAGRSAVPGQANGRGRMDRIILSGDLPSPSNPPPGRRFHTRCPAVRPLCSAERPALTTAGDGSLVACRYPLGA